MLYYKKNLDVIKEKNKELYHALLSKMEKDNISCLSVVAKNGMSILKVKKDDKIYLMGSQYNPEQEAIHFAKQYEKIKDYSYMIFFGLGNGVIARTVINLMRENVKFLFYEPSISIFDYVLKNYDLTEILSIDKVSIVVKGLNDKNIENIIATSINRENYRWCILDALPLYKKIFNEDYNNIEEKYRFYVDTVRINISTNKFFAKKEISNTIMNMKELFHSNCEEEFEGVFPINRPAIVVAAGPSLENNVEYLREVKGKLFVIAVDTALRYLVSKGIQPDLAVIADPQKPICLFEDERVRNIPLALSAGANNDIIRMMNKQKLIFVSAKSSYYEKIYNIVGKHSYTITTGGSVATLAFMLAIAWGYTKIILVGQDLAFDKDKVHAGKNDIGLNKLEENKIEIEGYYGGKVYTSSDYDYYRRWYETAVSSKILGKKIEVINATEGGAKIEGTVQKNLKEVIDEYKDVDFFDFEGIIRNKACTFEEKNRIQVIEMWKESIVKYDYLKKIIYEGIRRLKEVLRTIEMRKDTPNKIIRVLNKLKKIFLEINSFDEVYFIDGMIEKEEGDILSELFELQQDNTKEMYKLLERLLKHLRAMYKEIDEVKNMFESLVEDTINESCSVKKNNILIKSL